MDSKEDQKCKDKEDANPRRYAKRRKSDHVCANEIYGNAQASHRRQGLGTQNTP